MTGGVRAERRRRALRGLVLALGFTAVAVFVGYLALWVTARFLIEGRERAAFFVGDRFDERPLVVAHQGGELLRPPNTMVAFRHADELGADILDTDVQRTADGVLVLLHDETVDATSDGTGPVGDLTLAELRELDFGHRFTTDDGATFPYRGRGHGIVTVEELFDEMSDGRRFGIEMKQIGAEGAAELCRLIEDFGYEDRVLVSSFGQDTMDRFRTECPDVATSATEGEVRVFYYLHRAGLNGLVEPSYDALQVPERSAGRLVVSQDFVDDAADWGVPVIPWTIDEPEDMDRLLDLGVAGLNTNRPDLLIDRTR